MDINLKATHGRRLMVEFKCYRCQTTALRDFDVCLRESSESYQGMYDLQPPKDWENGGFYHPTFCPDCAKAYERFMGGGDGDG